jgi:hypothetical protein
LERVETRALPLVANSEAPRVSTLFFRRARAEAVVQDGGQAFVVHRRTEVAVGEPSAASALDELFAGVCGRYLDEMKQIFLVGRLQLTVVRHGESSIGYCRLLPRAQFMHHVDKCSRIVDGSLRQ